MLSENLDELRSFDRGQTNGQTVIGRKRYESGDEALDEKVCKDFHVFHDIIEQLQMIDE
jgi:hypothetical protein